MSGDCISNSHYSNEIRKEIKSAKDHDAFCLLRKQPLDYRNKFESISELIEGTFNIFLINETKSDASFPSNQFALPG